MQKVRGSKVLWVGNHRKMCEVVQRVLARHDAQVRVVHTADEAMPVVEEWRPHVLIVDVAMPGQDGYTFIRRVRALEPERGGETPAIAFTQHLRIIDRLRALGAGYQMHIATPIQAAEIALAVADLLRD
jgi:CheY-like chemotaxis protein